MEHAELTSALAASRWFCKPMGMRLQPVLLRPAFSSKPNDYRSLADLGRVAGQSWSEAVDGAREAWRYTSELATVGVTRCRRPTGRRLRKTGGRAVQLNTRRVSDDDWARIVFAREAVHAARMDLARVESEAFDHGEPMTVGCRIE